MGLLQSLLNIFKNYNTSYEGDMSDKTRFNDLVAIPKQNDGNNIRITKSELKEIIEKETDCKNVSFGDSEYDLVNLKFLEDVIPKLGVHHLKYLKSYKFEEEFEKIDTNPYYTDNVKEIKKNEIRKSKNLDCENFAVLFDGLMGVVDGSLALGKCEGSKYDTSGKLS